MVQLEVAEAIVARPGAMSLLERRDAGLRRHEHGDEGGARRVLPAAEGAVGGRAHRRAPQPRVDVPLDAFFRVVRAGFGNPRKQLRNSLSFGLHVKQDVIDGVMRGAGIDATLRPQVLSLDDWAAITRAWIARLNQ